MRFKHCSEHAKCAYARLEFTSRPVFKGDRFFLEFKAISKKQLLKFIGFIKFLFHSSKICKER